MYNHSKLTSPGTAMDEEEGNPVLIDESFVMYSLLYSGVTVVFGIAVLFKFLNSELRLGFRSVLSLIVLFVGEPVCQFFIRRHWGFATFALGCFFLYATLPASHLDSKNKTVLITGCDSGFGHALAKRLDDIGMQVFAACLHGNGPGAQILRSTSSSKVHVFEMNVTNEKQVQAAVKFVESKIGEEGLWGLVNNAGIWYCAEIDMMPWTLFQEVLNINLLGTIYVTKTFLPLLQKSQGRAVFISSVAGRIPLPHFSAYSTAKAGLEAFCDVLRHEMKKWRVKVSVIEPNCFYTESILHRSEVFQKVWDHMDEETRKKYGEDYFNAIFTKYDSLASTFPRDFSPVLRTAKSALLSRRPRTRYVTDKSAEFLMWLYSVLHPCLGDRLIEAITVITPKHIKPRSLS